MKTNYFALFLLCSLLFSCKEESETIHMRINHYKQTAMGLDPLLVFLSQEGNAIYGDDWNFKYAIEGFDYEWGKVYELEITKKQIDNPPSDGSSIEYHLSKVLSSNPVSNTTTFEITLKNDATGITNICYKDSDGIWQLGFEEIRIDCLENCDSLESYIHNHSIVIGTFTHSEDGKLLLQSLK